MGIMNNKTKLMGLETTPSARHLLKVGVELVVTAALAFYIIPVQASTSNNLREYLGYPKLTESTTNILNADGISDNVETPEISDEDFKAETIVQSGQDYKDELKYFRDQKESLERTIASRLLNNSSAFLITQSIDELIKVKESMTNLYETSEYAKDYIDVSVEVSGNNIPGIEQFQVETQLTEKALEMNRATAASIQTLDYNIGGLGEFAESPVDGFIRIVTPYGFNKESYQAEFQNKLLGLKLKAEVNHKIVSVWNGIVIDVSRDLSNNMDYIKIYHGNSLYTEYHHIKARSDIMPGTVVKSGEGLGTAADTRDYEPLLENHILFQVKLDGYYINPLLIYGQQGKKLYEDWVRTTLTENVVEKGELYYLDKKYDPTEYERYFDQTVIEVNSDFNKDQD